MLLKSISSVLLHRDTTGNQRMRLLTKGIGASYVLLLIITVTGCFPPTEQDVFDLPCGTGRLVLHEVFTDGFDVDVVSLELRYRTEKEERLVCDLHCNVTLYRDPMPDELYHHFREENSIDPWPVFVNPDKFTPQEYAQIFETLSNNLSAIDIAVGHRKKPTTLYEDRKPKISSIRYTNYNGVRRLYRYSEQRLGVEVDPAGQVWLGYMDPRSSGITGMCIGYVLENGSKIVLDPNPYTAPFRAENIVTNMHWFVRQCVNIKEKSLFDDFTVEVPSNAEAYRLASRAWVNRRDSYREKDKF
jgi:hypothetical protein